MSKVLAFFTIFHLSLHAASAAELVAAYLGAVNLPSFLFENVSGCNPNKFFLADGLPVTFDVPVDGDTLDPDQFLIRRRFGKPRRPTCATLEPADGPDEGYTVLLTGNFVGWFNPIVGIEIVDDKSDPLISINNEDLTGLSIEDIVVGSESGVSLALAFGFSGTGPNGQDQVQTIWEGGVTADQGVEITDDDLPSFWLVDSEGNLWNPDGFDDLNDGDNFIVLNVPPEAVTPVVRVEVEAETVFDPLNFPNPFTSVEVQQTVSI